MPYIRPEERPPLDAAIAAFPHGAAGMSAGQLAYVVYRLLRKNTLGVGFMAYATMVGAVVLTVARFVQKNVMQYEDGREELNGGVD